MTNKDLIKQYISSVQSLSEYQFKSLNPNQQRSYIRRRTIEFNQRGNYRYRPYEIDAMPPEEQYEMILKRFETTSALDVEHFQRLSDEQKKELISVSQLPSRVVQELDGEVFQYYVNTAIANKRYIKDQVVYRKMNTRQLDRYLANMDFELDNILEYYLEGVYQDFPQDKFEVVLKYKMTSYAGLSRDDLKKASGDFIKNYYDEVCEYLNMITPRDIPYMNEEQISRFMNRGISYIKTGKRFSLTKDEMDLLPKDKVIDFVSIKGKEIAGTNYKLEDYEFNLLSPDLRKEYVQKEIPTPNGVGPDVFLAMTPEERKEYYSARKKMGKNTGHFLAMFPEEELQNIKR